MVSIRGQSGKEEFKAAHTITREHRFRGHSRWRRPFAGIGIRIGIGIGIGSLILRARLAAFA